MVENCMSGYNSCMFAYGQTGSGKTHTMLGDIDDLDLRPSDKRGMTPRVFEYLFSKIQMVIVTNTVHSFQIRFGMQRNRLRFKAFELIRTILKWRVFLSLTGARKPQN